MGNFFFFLEGALDVSVLLMSADDRSIADGSIFRESPSKSLSGERVLHPQKALAQAKSLWNGLGGKRPLK